MSGTLEWKAPRRDAPELPLFDVATPEHPVADDLRKLAPDAMTPLEALQRLAEWKRRFGSG